MTFPSAYPSKLHTTNSIDGLNHDIKRRTDVVGIFAMKQPSAARPTHPA